MVRLDTSSTAWCDCQGRLIFLDLIEDRYFCLPEARERAFRTQLNLGDEDWQQPSSLPRPAEFRAAGRQSPAIGRRAFRLAGVAAALWAQRRVERRLARQPFGDVLREFQRLRDHRRSGTGDEQATDRVVEAFEQARLLRTAADRCLPRSIALALSLAAQGTSAQLIIGVRRDPFGAHSWVQQGDLVLNDSVEEVLRYTPILVL